MLCHDIRVKIPFKLMNIVRCVKRNKKVNMERIRILPNSLSGTTDLLIVLIVFCHFDF